MVALKLSIQGVSLGGFICSKSALIWGAFIEQNCPLQELAQKKSQPNMDPVAKI
tara:strand:- start:319 stop:480 length:162 start_codon:yes stop_codon:yes gene_type:complete